MRIPSHIGIIPDGNRRWALAHGLEKQNGYAHGLAPGLALLRLARQKGIREVTYYGFTTDNCKRPTVQRRAFEEACTQAVKLICAEGVSLLVLGDTSSPSFPQSLRRYTTRTDIAGGGIRVNFLVNYGWEWDLSALDHPPSRPALSGQLQSHDVSRLDLIIRWGGMRRLSGFLPVQSVYADFYVVDRLWPDFSTKDLDEALLWYNKQDITLGG